MARPPLAIDPVKVLELAQMGVPVMDIATRLGCDRGVLYRRFGKVIRRGRVLRKLALLEAQWKAVEAGDVHMLIWLGKNELGQSNKGTTTVHRAGDARPWELARALRRTGG